MNSPTLTVGSQDLGGADAQPALVASPLSPQAVSTKGFDQAQGLRVGFTGTRWRLTEPQGETLLSALVGFREGGCTWMHNGDCVGADEHAAKLWRTLGGRLQVHPPEVRDKRAFVRADILCPVKPYMDRNRDIVDESDVLIACPHEEFEQQRSGTWATIRYAVKQGKPVMIVWPSGRYTTGWPASADTHPKGGDSKAAPAALSGAVPKADAQTQPAKAKGQTHA